MALIPTIPTSFVPRDMSSGGSRRVRTDFVNVFGMFAYFVFGAVFFMAIGLFFYGRIQASVLSSKDAELAKAEDAIDQATIESFIQLRDRLDSSQKLLYGHVAFSGFFSAIQLLIPSTVRFTSLHLTINNGGAAVIYGAGVSKSFNALSVASESFASDGRIKDVIFSNMSVRKDGSVSFDMSASLDPKLTVFSPHTTETLESVVATSTTPAAEPVGLDI